MKTLALLDKHYPESRFGGFTDVDGTMVFYQRVQALLQPSHIALDIGCGRGAGNDDPAAARRNLRRLRDKCKWVIGIDVSSAGQTNPLVDEFRLIEGPLWPVEDASVDLCVADWVLEHVSDPAMFCSELGRVLRPGGYFCARTTNRLGYVAMADRLVPRRFRNGALRHACNNRPEQDVFPVLHRCNTARSLARLLREKNFDCIVYGYEAEPSYLGFSSVAFTLGVFWQRWSPHWLRNTLFVFAEKRTS